MTQRRNNHPKSHSTPHANTVRVPADERHLVVWNRQVISMLGIGLLIFALGCSKRTSTGTMQSAGTDSIAKPKGPLSVTIRLTHTDSTSADSLNQFGPRDTVHAIIHTENARDTSVLDGRWMFLNIRDSRKNSTTDRGTVIAENKANLSAGTNDTHFDLINANPWPVGEYELIVTVDQHTSDSIRFPIVARGRKR